MLGLLIDAMWPWTISCAALARVPLDMAQMGLAGRAALPFDPRIT